MGLSEEQSAVERSPLVVRAFALTRNSVTRSITWRLPMLGWASRKTPSSAYSAVQ
jgi:hypothetical protein